MGAEKRWADMVDGSKRAIEEMWDDLEEQAIVYAANRIKELEKELKKIANTEYCDDTGCLQGATAKQCRECAAKVANRVLGEKLEFCGDCNKKVKVKIYNDKVEPAVKVCAICGQFTKPL